MKEYCHHVSGFFATKKAAEAALSQLVELGLPGDRLRVIDAHATRTGEFPKKGDSDEVLKDVLVDGAIGTAVGTGIGALAQLALVAGSVSLFVASPLVAPLAMLGWGASLGGFIGAAAGAGSKTGWFSDLVRDAIASGQFVLVAETRTEQESAIAREVIEVAVGSYKDIGAE